MLLRNLSANKQQRAKKVCSRGITFQLSSGLLYRFLETSNLLASKVLFLDRDLFLTQYRGGHSLICEITCQPFWCAPGEGGYVKVMTQREILKMNYKAFSELLKAHTHCIRKKKKLRAICKTKDWVWPSFDQTFPDWNDKISFESPAFSLLSLHKGRFYLVLWFTTLNVALRILDFCLLSLHQTPVEAA